MKELNQNRKAVIVEVGGHQQVAVKGEKILTQRIDKKEGETVKIKNLLTGEELNFKVISHKLGEKIRGLKFKNKTRYLKRYGHRQQHTVLELADHEAKLEDKISEAPKKVTKKSNAKK